MPELRNEPDRLAIWVEDGKVAARHTGTLGFAFEYPLSVYLKEIGTDIAIITLAIVRWLRVNQPDLLVHPNRFDFETDVWDNETADLQFTLQLTENVAVTPNDDGSHGIDYLPEPDPLFEDGEEVAADAGTPDLTGHSVDDIVND